MTTCYACEFKEYTQGNQIPSKSCPRDCTILHLFRGLGVGLRGVQTLAYLMARPLSELDQFLIDFEETEQIGDLRESARGVAYRRIYDWHKKNCKLIYEIYGRRDKYSEAYLKLVDSLPAPGEATDADMLFVAHQVLTLLMEWSYGQEDKYGTKMHEYAGTIKHQLENTDTDMKQSRLNDIVIEYQRKKGE